MTAGLPRDLQLLLIESFGKDNYAESFPQVFGSLATAKQFIIRDNHAVAAFCASIPFHWQVNDCRITGYCIGSVCSSEKYRGQGFASRAISLAEIDAKSNGADFTFLFSDLDIFYRKLSYQSYGKELFAPLAASPAFNQTACQNLIELKKMSSDTDHSLRYGFTKPGEAISPDHTMRLWNLVSKSSHPSENILGFSDFQQLLNIPLVEIHTLWHGATPVAAFFVGKGADFENVAHSAAAEHPTFLAKLFSCHFERFPASSLVFMLPPGERALSQHLTCTNTPSYFAKILRDAPLEHSKIERLLCDGILYPRTFQSI
jgi:predicted N-acetyltransferase YhbS